MRKDAAPRTIPAFARDFHDALGFSQPERSFITSNPRRRGKSRRPRVDTRRPAQALILAAGGGSRLGEGAKCLCDIGGRPLIDHQLDALENVGIESVGVVVGFEQERIREVIGGRARFIVNELFAETNSLYSFMLARGWVKRDVVVLNCDVLFHPHMVRMVQGHHRNALLYDSDSGGEAEEMKVALRGDRLDEMSKELPPNRTRGENVGILRLDRPTARHAFAVATRLVARGGHRDWLASAINRTARKHQFKCVDVAGLPWTEIDFPDDLERARRRVWPAILASGLSEQRTVLGPPATDLAGRRDSAREGVST